MKVVRMVAVALFSVALLGGVASCKKEAGPAERLGESLDKAAESAAEGAADAAEKVEKAAEEATK